MTTKISTGNLDSSIIVLLGSGGGASAAAYGVTNILIMLKISISKLNVS